ADQYHTWWRSNVTVPVRVSTACEPCEKNVVALPVAAVHSSTLLEPPNSKRSTDVPTPPARLVTATSSGNGQSPRSTPLDVAAGDPRPTVASTAATADAGARVAGRPRGSWQ